MTFKEFLKLERDGFQLYGHPKFVNGPLGDIQTQSKFCKPEKDGKSFMKRDLARLKGTNKPARPAGLHGKSSMTIKSNL